MDSADAKKGGELPSYSAAVKTDAPPHRPWRRGMRRSRALRVFGLACLAFIVYAQWKQISNGPNEPARKPGAELSVEKLLEGYAMCAKLQSKPQDPIGFGRERNARYIAGQKPTLIRNATVWVGEAVEGTSAEDARAGKGYSWVVADVFLEHGLIKRVGIEPELISLDALPADVQVWDAYGRPLTSGIIDMHSHAGVDSLPGLRGTADTNELSSDITPYVRSIDAIQPQDHQIQVIKSGGVTTSLILPGSGNNIGGEAYVIKHAVGTADGRPELSVADMLADPDRTWRYMKMACGENAKRVYGKVGEHGPTSRMGESWEFRHAFEQAALLVRLQDDWCAAAAAAPGGPASMSSYLPLDLRWEALGAVLRGQVHVNTHCYTIPDLEAYVDHTNEFRFPVRAFHHAHSTYLVPEILKRAWGGDPPASALFADNMYYKAESYVASEYAGKELWDAGLTPIYVSDNPVLNAQHVLFEAAKAYHYGLPYHAALSAVTSAPAERLGLGQRIGKVKPGFDADVVVWDSDPLSVGAAPVQVWIDGTAQFKDPVELDKPFNGVIIPDESLGRIPEEKVHDGDVVFTGVSKVLLSGYEGAATATGGPVNVAISRGQITCVGACEAELRAASAGNNGASGKVVDLKNGYLTPSFTAFGGTLGLNEIDAERDTDNGPSGDVFTRAADGLALEGKKLAAAHKYGVTRAISAPSTGRGATHYGVSVGFLTGAKGKLDKGAVFADDVAVHYTLTTAAKDDKTPSIASAVGALRHALLEAVASSNETVADVYSEAAFLQKVVAGELPLVLTVHSADTIAAVLQVKKVVEDAIAAKTSSSTKLRVAIIGGAESHLVAAELAAAGVGVVLAPLQSYATEWEERRALTGAPLTNGTAVDALVAAGVVAAVGLEEDWVVRDLALLAGVAYRNGGGRLSEKQALDLVSANVYRMLGVKPVEEEGHFVVSEGSPLEIGSRIKAVGGGLGYTTVFA